MKIFNGEKWVNVAGDAGFEDDVLYIGGTKNDKQIRILDENDEVIGLMSREQIEFTKAHFGDVQAVNVITKNTQSTYNVPSAGSIQEIIDTIPRHLSKATIINVPAGTYNEDVRFEGFSGHGALTLNLDKDTVINGRIIVYGCNNLYIVGNQATLNHTYESENAIYVRYSRFVSVETLKIYGRGNANQSPASLRAVYFTEGSTGRVADCTLSNFVGELAYAVCANYGSQVYVVNNIGSNNTFSYVATRASYIGGYGTMPKSGNKTATLHGSTLVGDFTEKDDEGNISAIPEATKTITFTPTSYRFWRTVINKWQDGIYMGDFSKSTGGSGTGGNNTGCFLFDVAAIRKALSGKTLISTKITLQRKTSGGYDATTTPELATVNATGSGSAPVIVKNYGALSGFTKGQQKNITISNTVISDLISNANVKGLALHRSDKKQYSIFENLCTLTITYKEPVATSTLEIADTDSPMILPLD